MRSIAILNQKGGVGKTTTAVNVAAGLAEAGQRVLLVDLDPQSHATMHVGIEPASEQGSVYDVLVRRVPLAGLAHGVSDRLVVIPAHLDLVGAEVELANQADRETVLMRALRPYQEGFDYCLIDCAPSLGLLTVNALATVQEVIIPLQPHFLALQGLGRLLQTVTLVRQSLNPELRVSGVVLCMYERGTRLAQEVREDVTQFVASASPEDPWYGACVFDTVIRRNIKLAECPSFGKTIFDYAATSHGAEDYRNLAAEIAANGQAHPSAKPAATTPMTKDEAEVVPPADSPTTAKTKSEDPETESEVAAEPPATP